MVVAILWAGMPCPAHATAKIPDINVVGKDAMCLFCTPIGLLFHHSPAVYNIEQRTREGYQILNDYNHLYYNKEINPHFWPFRALCKYLLELADPTLPFDSDDER